MILHFDHPALSFHCAAELPPQFRAIMMARPVRADRCYTTVFTNLPAAPTQPKKGPVHVGPQGRGTSSVAVGLGAPVITLSSKSGSYNPATAAIAGWWSYLRKK